jgi:hypothetical protein
MTPASLTQTPYGRRINPQSLFVTKWDLINLCFFSVYSACFQSKTCLTEAASLTLRFEEAENVVFTDGSLDVTDDGARSVVHEFNADLSDTTTGASAAENLCNLGKLDGSLLSVLLEGED